MLTIHIRQIASKCFDRNEAEGGIVDTKAEELLYSEVLILKALDALQARKKLCIENDDLMI